MKRISLFLFFLFFACNSNKPIMEAVLIDLSKTKQVNAGELFKTSYIKLETNDDNIIGSPNQIEIIGDLIYILDCNMSMSLSVFNTDGKFIAVVGKQGQGPGEYITPFFFNVSEQQNILAIIDAGQQKLLMYDLTDYSFLQELQLPFNSTSMEWLPENKMIWYEQSPSDNIPNHYLIVTDENINIIDKFLENNFPTGYNIGVQRKIFRVNETIYTYNQLSPFIYNIDDHQAIPGYEIKFADNQLPSVDYLNRLSKNNTINFIPELLDSEYVSFFDVFEANQTFCIPYYADKKMYYGFYDKISCISYRFAQDQLGKELKVGAFSSPVGCSNDCFISLLNPYVLHEKKVDGFVFDDRLEELIKISSPEDNPILLMYGIDN